MLRKKFSAPQFTTLAQTTFDYLLAFQKYIDSLIANRMPIDSKTHSLTPAGMKLLKEDRAAIKQWLADVNGTVPTDFEEK